ncbi:MAG: chromate transporter [Firmicutes bacterium]|nr:chromate transporter [Bacillota bacterium]MBR6025831.1 chromate transporter [Bacillota bacterium]
MIHNFPLVMQLCLTYIKISLAAFGGGYAAVGLTQQEIVDRLGWISTEQFINMVAIAEMTPGPIGINSATFVGYVIDGVVAGILASFSFVLVPACLVLLCAILFEKVKGNPKIQAAVAGIRPVAIAIIAAAVFSIAKTSFNDIYALIPFAVAAVLTFKFKKGPILCIIVCGIIGIVMYGFII